MMAFEEKNRSFYRSTVSTYPDQNIRRKIGDRRFNCINESFGCKESLKYEDLEAHSHICQFSKFECINEDKGCTKLLEKYERESHANEECDYREIYCVICGKPFLAKDLPDHNTSCKKLQTANSKHKLFNSSDSIVDISMLKELCEKSDNQLKRLEEDITDLNKMVEKLKEANQSHKALVSRVQMVSAEIIENHSDFSSKCELQKDEIDKCVTKDETREVKDRLDAIQADVRKQSTRGLTSDGQTFISAISRLAALEEKTSQMHKSLSLMKDSSYNGTFIWKLDNYSKRKRDAINGTNVSIYSVPFHIGRYGYTIRARVYLNGDGNGKGSHFSFFITIIRGDYDDTLKWPFAQKTTLMLLDLTGKGRHIKDTFLPAGLDDCFKKPTTASNLSSGTPLFAPQSAIEEVNSPYIRNDNIYLKIKVDLNGLKDV